jgi:hypothetical protein
VEIIGSGLGLVKDRESLCGLEGLCEQPEIVGANPMKKSPASSVTGVPTLPDSMVGSPIVITDSPSNAET